MPGTVLRIASPETADPDPHPELDDTPMKVRQTSRAAAPPSLCAGWVAALPPPFGRPPPRIFAPTAAQVAVRHQLPLDDLLAINAKRFADRQLEADTPLEGARAGESAACGGG